MPKAKTSEIPVYGGMCTDSEGDCKREFCGCDQPTPARTVVIEGVEFEVPISGAFHALCAKCGHIIRDK